MRKRAIILLALLVTGCATITKGTTQTVAVDTPGVPGAVCTIQTQNGPQMVTTPGTVVLNKGSAPFVTGGRLSNQLHPQMAPDRLRRASSV